jgi:hypothetical protein
MQQAASPYIGGSAFLGIAAFPLINRCIEPLGLLHWEMVKMAYPPFLININKLFISRFSVKAAALVGSTPR